MISRLIDRVRLVVWALVFLAGVLLVVPLAFRFAALVSANHGIVAGIVAGLLAAAFVGFGLTALAVSRSDDLKRLPAHQRTIYIISLPGAAISIVGGMFLEVISGSIASSLAWPIAALVILAAVVVAYRLRKGDPGLKSWARADRPFASRPAEGGWAYTKEDLFTRP